MASSSKEKIVDANPELARNWVKILAQYREPDTVRSIFELLVTLVPFLVLWSLAWWLLSISPWLALAVAVSNGLFLVRIFIVQHDCSHGGFFNNRRVGDWVGRIFGVLTLTPYGVWQRTHLLHHSASGNLDQRGIGDVYTMTVEEYYAKPFYSKVLYRLGRNPIILFGLGPLYLFILQNRLPLGLMTSGTKYWISAMGTNAMVAGSLGIIFVFGGVAPILWIFFPTLYVAATLGVWLFYVQHQFEDTHWDAKEDWQVHDAALHGSSHYDLPKALMWITGNIGIHHVHHLYSRIPFYRLTEVLRDHPVLASSQHRLTFIESLRSVKLHLWDEHRRKLVSFAEARRSRAPA
ncbi:MAG: fatty acid desaturase [Paracoccaceae bacterium]|nr:fatty acid desaturase [Paracoccaceae bacterium]